MSAISDWKEVWSQKFPGSELPPAWEEDVKNNLAIHKKRLEELQNQLKEEEKYVDFLETLLRDVEKQKSSSATNGKFQSSEESQPENEHKKDKLNGQERHDVDNELEEEGRACGQGTEEFSEEEASSVANVANEGEDVSEAGLEELEASCVRDDDLEEESSEKESFVTVIEVNGVEKGLKGLGGEKRLKQPPPKPPPKHCKPRFKSMPASSPSAPAFVAESRYFDFPMKCKEPKWKKENTPGGNFECEPRQVRFDGKKNSGETSHVREMISNYAGSKVPMKKFEGSKQPILQDENGQHDLDVDKIGFQDGDDIKGFQGIAKSSILSKFKSQQNKPHSSSNEFVGPRKRSFRKNNASSNEKNTTSDVPRSLTNHNEQTDLALSDYIDPLDANVSDIYNNISPEPLSPTICNSLVQQNDPGNRCMGTEYSLDYDPQDENREPLYDAVAADPEDPEDDYVTLNEDPKMEVKDCMTPLPKGKHNLAKQDIFGNGFSNYNARHNFFDQPASSNNDASTIKSQTSVISGHSITTTTSSGTTSDTDGITGSPLPQDSANNCAYANIDMFIQRKESRGSVDSDDESGNSNARPCAQGILYPEENISVDRIQEDAFQNTRERKRCEQPTMDVSEQEKIRKFRRLVIKMKEAEKKYFDKLKFLKDHQTAFLQSMKTSKPITTQDECKTIFFMIPELWELHKAFWQGLDLVDPPIGKLYENLANEIHIYQSFLGNYSRAIETVKKCTQIKSEFAKIASSIKVATSGSKHQEQSLETVLHSPVLWVQESFATIRELRDCLPDGHPDKEGLKNALTIFQDFINQFETIDPNLGAQHTTSGSSRTLHKNSFIIEYSEGQRKLRHLFLFNDVLICAKYRRLQSSGAKPEKMLYDIKWYIPLMDCTVLAEQDSSKEVCPPNVASLRSQATTVREQIKRQTSKEDARRPKAEKQRKKLVELEKQLVLVSPNLVFKVKSKKSTTYTFFFSSEYERSQWTKEIAHLKKQHIPTGHINVQDLQHCINKRRKSETNMGSYLMRTETDGSLLGGDFYIFIGQIKSGVQRPADLYICLEVDSYGHFFRKVKTDMICKSTHPVWNTGFNIELDGAQNLRVLLYEEHKEQSMLLRAITEIELSGSWLKQEETERELRMDDYVLTIKTKFTSSDNTIKRIPTAKPTGLFGAKISQVLRNEKRKINIPFIVTSCVEEVNSRGLKETGIYRISGSASDIVRLKKAYETDSYEAKQRLKEVDIHSVTGILKMYLRELPEALFTDELYPRFVAAFNEHDPNVKKEELLRVFSMLPEENKTIINYLLEHMINVFGHETHNKMTLHNLVTIFGPTLLHPGAKGNCHPSVNLLVAGTEDVMAQAGILHFFVTHRVNNIIKPAIEID